MNPTAPDDLQARVGIAKGAPWAFLTAKAIFIAIALYTLTSGDLNWTATVLAVAMIPAVIVTFIALGTVNRLLFENERLTRELRATARH